MKKLLAVLMTLVCLPLNGCLKLGGSGSSSPPGAPQNAAYGGPPPLIGSIAVDLRKGK